MRKVLFGIGSGIFYSILSMVFALLSTPYFLKYISKEEFGCYLLINNLIVWAGLLNLGLRGSFKLQLSAAVGKGEETDKLISTAFIIQCLVGLSVLIIGNLIVYFFPSLIPHFSIGNNYQYIFIFLITSFALTLISNPLASVLSVYNLDFEIYMSRSILLVFQTLLCFSLLALGIGMKGLAIASIASELFFLGFVFYLIQFKLALVKFKLSNFDSKLFKSSLAMGKWFVAGFLAQLFIRHTDLFLIERFAGLGIITSFIITSKLYLLATSFLLIIIKVALPQLTKIVQSDKNDLVSSEATVIFLKAITLFTLITGIGIYLVNESFISWWVGKSLYLGDEINLMLLLVFIFGSFNYAARTLFMAHIKFKTQKILSLIEGMIHIFGSLILGYFFHLLGIVTSMFISAIAASLISYYIVITDNLLLNGYEKELRTMGIYISVCITLVLIEFSYSLSLISLIVLFIFVLGSYLFMSMKEVRVVVKSLRF